MVVGEKKNKVPQVAFEKKIHDALENAMFIFLSLKSE